MYRTLTLLLAIIVSTSMTVATISDELTGWITSSMCILAYGSKDSNRNIDFYGTKCDTNCYIADRKIVFECKNYKRKCGKIHVSHCLEKCFSDRNLESISQTKTEFSSRILSDIFIYRRKFVRSG